MDADLLTSIPCILVARVTGGVVEPAVGTRAVVPTHCVHTAYWTNWRTQQALVHVLAVPGMHTIMQ